MTEKTDAEFISECEALNALREAPDSEHSVITSGLLYRQFTEAIERLKRATAELPYEAKSYSLTDHVTGMLVFAGAEINPASKDQIESLVDARMRVFEATLQNYLSQDAAPKP